MKKITALDTNRISNIYDELVEIAEIESMKLYRMARNAEKHGCSEMTVDAIRVEARELGHIAYGDVSVLFDPFKVWQYAFH